MRPPTIQLRTPFARAVVPVVAGLAVIALIMLATWGVAAFIAGGGAESSERLAPPTFEVGDVRTLADIVERDGPLLLPGLNTTAGERSLVVDHTGSDPTRRWQLYWAYPAGGSPSCVVEQDRGTRTFVDCEGRELDVTELEPPEGVNPVVEDGRRLSIDLRSVVVEPTVPATTLG